MADDSLMFSLELVCGSNEKEYCELLVVAEHVVVDGVSLMHWTHELNLAMEDPSKEWEPRPLIPPSQFAVLDRVFPSIFDRVKGVAAFSFELCQKLAFVSFLPRIAPPAIGNAVSEDFSKPVLTSEPCHVEPEAMKRLALLAKENGVTL